MRLRSRARSAARSAACAKSWRLALRRISASSSVLPPGTLADWMRPALGAVWGWAALKNPVSGVLGQEVAQRFLLHGATRGRSRFHEGPRSAPPTGVSMISSGFSADVLCSSGCEYAQTRVTQVHLSAELHALAVPSLPEGLEK